MFVSWVPNCDPSEETPTRWKLQVGLVVVTVFQRFGDTEGWWAEAKYLCGGAGIVYDRVWFNTGVEEAKKRALERVCIELEKQLNALRNVEIRELVFRKIPPLKLETADEEADR
jgi:hypothetical protein